MKICIISPNRQHLQSISGFLESQGHTTVQAEGGKSRVSELAGQEQPDVILVDGMCCDLNELQHVEHATRRYPSMAVVLLCATQTPDFLIGAMRAGVREVLPSPPAQPALAAALERIASRSEAAPKQGQVLAFIPAKGGSGATFLATNLGWELASSRSVLLVDLNLQFGDALTYVRDGKPATTIADVARDIDRLDASLLASSATRIDRQYSLLAAPEDIAEGVDIAPSHIKAVLDIARSQFDFVLIDVPRSMDPVALCALDAATCIYVAMQASLPDVRHANRLLKAFQSLGYPPDRTEIILNRYDRFSEIGSEELSRKLNNIKVHTVPNSFKDVHTSINHGEPLPKASRSNPVARQISQLAQSLQPAPRQPKGLLGRLFRTA